MTLRNEEKDGKKWKIKKDLKKINKKRNRMKKRQKAYCDRHTDRVFYAKNSAFWLNKPSLFYKIFVRSSVFEFEAVRLSDCLLTYRQTGIVVHMNSCAA